MASPNYNHHPLPSAPSYGQEEEQYTPYDDRSPLPQPPAHQYQSRPQQQLPPQPRQQQSQQKQQQPPPKTERRPRSRGFSFRSDKSHKSHKSVPSAGAYKVTGQETSAEKESNRLHGKADPSLAMQELEPCEWELHFSPVLMGLLYVYLLTFLPAAVAQSSANFSEYVPLRSLQHKDSSGSPIG
jgi:hypothetical protein